MKSKAAVVTLVREKIRLLHFAYSTEQSYCGWVARYYDFCRGLPAGLPSEQKTEAFLTFLAQDQRVAAKTQNQAFAALLFLYEHVLGQPLEDVDALRAKQPVHERVAPSREQVRALRAAVQDTPTTPNRLLVDLLYGCGLRVSEPLELRTKEVLWTEGPAGQLVIRGAKGGKDRRVPIPSVCDTSNGAMTIESPDPRRFVATMPIPEPLAGARGHGNDRSPARDLRESAPSAVDPDRT